MRFSDELIDDFIERWERACGERLTRDMAQIEASNLMEVYEMVMQSLPPELRAKLDEKNRTGGPPDSPRPRRD